MIANVLNAAVPFLLMPVLTRHLTAAEYGVVAMFQVLIGIVAPFIGVSVHGAIQLRFFSSRESLPVYIANCFFILLGSTGLAAFTLYIFAKPISRVASFPVEWLWVVVAVAVSQFLMLIRLTVWQADVKPARYGLLQIGRTVLSLSVQLWLIIGLGLGWEGSIGGQLVASLGVAIVSLGSLWRDGLLKLQLDVPSIRNALNFGVPLIPHAVAGFAIVATDRLFITNMVGVEATGVYLVAAQISMGLSLLFTSFNTAYAPWLFRRLKSSNAETDAKIVRLTYAYIPAALLLAASVGFVAPLFLKFYVGEEFVRAHEFVTWLALGSAFNGMYMMVTNYIFFAERTRLLFLATSTAAVMNLLLSYTLIRSNGALGAAQATAATLFCKFVFTWWLSAKVHPMPWRAGFLLRARLGTESGSGA